jgi:hypothetical protein
MPRIGFDTGRAAVVMSTVGFAATRIANRELPVGIFRAVGTLWRHRAPPVVPRSAPWLTCRTGDEEEDDN